MAGFWQDPQQLPNGLESAKATPMNGIFLDDGPANAYFGVRKFGIDPRTRP